MASTNDIDPLIPMTLVGAVKETFSVQASTPLKVLGAEAIEPTPISGIDIVSAIGLRSSDFQGVLALCFPKGTFLGVVNRMLGETYSEINRENADAAGELLNIIYASARVKLNEGGYDFLPNIPTIARGTEINISHGASSKIVRIKCQCEPGLLFLEVSLRLHQKAA